MHARLKPIYLLNYKITREEQFRTLAQICFQTGIFAGFSLYIVYFAGRDSEAAMGGARGAQRPVLRVNEVKNTVARTAMRQETLLLNNMID
jgi:hypothetical protein